MRNFITGSIIILSLFLVGALAYAASAGRTSGRFSGITMPYSGSPGLQAAKDMYGIEGSSKTSWVGSVDAAFDEGGGVITLAGTNTEISGDTLGVIDNPSFASTVTLNGVLDADVTADFEGTVVVNGQLQTVGELEVDGVLDADLTADFEGTVVIHGQLQTIGELEADGAIDADGTADFALTVTNNGSTLLMGDIYTDRWSNTTPATYVANTFLGVDVVGADNIIASVTTTTIYNVAVGYQAAYELAAGDSNIAIGFKAGYSLGEGSENIFIGYQAGQSGGSDSASDDNIAIGTNSMTNLTTGMRNLALGQNSCDDSSTGITSGDYNICLGWDANVAVATNDYQLSIGGNATFPITSTDYRDVISFNGVGVTLSAEVAFAGADTNPSVKGSNMFVLSGDSTTIADFDDGTAGQVIYLRATDGDTDITDGSNLNLAGDFTGDGGDTITLYTPDGTNWYETGRSAN